MRLIIIFFAFSLTYATAVCISPVAKAHRMTVMQKKSVDLGKIK
jgi:hypothetical protein